MSGLEALGAAASIAQLLEIGIRLTKKAFEIYENGTTKRMEELKSQVEEFRAQNEAISAQYQSNSRFSNLEKSIEQTARKCDLVALGLLVELQSLNMQGHKSVFKSISIAFKDDKQSKWGSRIKKYESKLEALRKTLLEQVVQLLSEKQSDVQKTLLRMERQNTEMEADLTATLNRQTKAILRAIEEHDSANIHDQLYDLQKEGQNVLIQQQILSSLRCDEQRTVNDAESRTYEWIFDGVSRHTAKSKDKGALTLDENELLPPVNYTRWLSHENGIYWIEGKPGCGKSTLMKYISNHSRTRDLLGKWAPGRRAVIASHYFWISGSPLQRSLEGLLRSILWGALRRCPELIERVCPARWSDDAVGRDTRSMPWCLSDLQQCGELLASGTLQRTNQTSCFCFFIDGLDEYESTNEQKRHVIKLFYRLAEAENVKICISSREWEVFKTGFAQSSILGNHLVLHRYTTKDIARVVHVRLEQSVEYQKQRNSHEIELLVADVIQKAEGVFLWVEMVLRELIDGFENWDDIALLRERLRAIPSDLEIFFERIFNNVPQIYRQKSARLFKACLNADAELPIYVASLLEDDDPRKTVLDMPADSSGQWFNAQLITKTRKQINGRCQDLLMIDIPGEQTGSEATGRVHASRLVRIRFIHRTVRDWLQYKKSLDLDASTGENFDVFETLFAAYVYLIKRAPLSAAPDQLEQEVIIDWSTQALVHASRTSGSPLDYRLIQELDRVMTGVFNIPEKWSLSNGHTNEYVNRHWSNNWVLMTSPATTSEKGQRDLLGHCIEIGVEWLLNLEIHADASILCHKRGRPYLDYALRISRIFVSLHRWHTPDMVRVLLDAGCDANEAVPIEKGRTIWDLFLAFMHDTGFSETDRETTWLLIQSGARDVAYCEVKNTESRERMTLSMREILSEQFGEEEAGIMCEAIAKNAKQPWFGFLWGS